MMLNHHYQALIQNSNAKTVLKCGEHTHTKWSKYIRHSEKENLHLGSLCCLTTWEMNSEQFLESLHRSDLSLDRNLLVPHRVRKHTGTFLSPLFPKPNNLISPLRESVFNQPVMFTSFQQVLLHILSAELTLCLLLLMLLRFCVWTIITYSIFASCR